MSTTTKVSFWLTRYYVSEWAEPNFNRNCPISSLKTPRHIFLIIFISKMPSRVQKCQFWKKIITKNFEKNQLFSKSLLSHTVWSAPLLWKYGKRETGIEDSNICLEIIYLRERFRDFKSQMFHCQISTQSITTNFSKVIITST